MSISMKQILVPAFGKISYIVEDIYVKGGMRCVTTKQLRDTIPLASRKAGMLVYAADTDTVYKLSKDLATWQTFSGTGTQTNDTWQPSQIYTVGKQVVPPAANGHLYTCVNPGTTGTAIPAWPMNGTVVVDGGASWKDAGLLPNAVVAPYHIAATLYAINALCQPEIANGRYYKCTTGGTANTVAPVPGAWPTSVGQTYVDGTVTWTDMGSVMVFASGGGGGITVQSLPAAATISQNDFIPNNLCAFDYTNCPDQPNYISGSTTSFSGLNLSSSDGDRLVEIGVDVVGGTTGIWYRAKPTSSSPWTAWARAGAGATASSGSISVLKTAHGFSKNSIIAVDPTGAYVLAKSDTALTCEVVGIVLSVTDANNFVMQTSNGLTTGLFTGLAAGTVYYVSNTAAGALMSTIPPVGSISKPVFVATSATDGFFMMVRGVQVPAPLFVSTPVNLDTSTIASHLITLTNNSGVNIPMVQVVDTTGTVRHDVVVTISPTTLVFDFTAVTTPTGIWKAIIVG